MSVGVRLMKSIKRRFTCTDYCSANGQNSGPSTDAISKLIESSKINLQYSIT